MATPKNKQQIYTACVLDTETGGLDANTCAITQLSCQMVRLDTYEIIGVFDEYIKPYPKGDFYIPVNKTLRKKREIEKEENSYFEYNQQALRVTGLSIDLLNKSGKDINEVANDFLAFVKKCTIGTSKAYRPILVGHNIQFDLNFLFHLFIYTGKMKEFSDTFSGTEDIFGNFHPQMVDTMTLSRMAYADDPGTTSYKLGSMTEKMGIELVDAHSSMADVEATNGLFTIFCNRMKCGASEGENTGLIKQAEKTRVHFKI